MVKRTQIAIDQNGEIGSILEQGRIDLYYGVMVCMPDIRTCIADLNQSDEACQAAAATALAAMAEGAQPAIIALIQACSSSNEDVLNWCTAALEDVGPPSLSQLEDLTLLAKSANPDVAYWAITLLGRAGEQAGFAVSVLAERVVDRSAPEVQRRAAWALGRVGSKARTAVATLRRIAEEPNAALADQARQAIQQIEAA